MRHSSVATHKDEAHGSGVAWDLDEEARDSAALVRSAPRHSLRFLTLPSRFRPSLPPLLSPLLGRSRRSCAGRPTRRPRSPEVRGPQEKAVPGCRLGVTQGLSVLRHLQPRRRGGNAGGETPAAWRAACTRRVLRFPRRVKKDLLGRPRAIDPQFCPLALTRHFSSTRGASASAPTTRARSPCLSAASSSAFVR